MDTSYNPNLVALSIAVAVFASFTALDLAGRYRVQEGRSAVPWLVGAAWAMGGGIWSMHFIGMLAFNTSVPVRYDVVLTLLSLATPVVTTGIGFFVVRRRSGNLAYLLLAGVITGLSIVSMHYIGMEALRMQADVHHDRLFIWASIVIAVVAATSALALSFALTGRWQRLVAAPIMGLAVSGMHYVAMAGAHFMPPASPVDLQGVFLDPPVIAANLAIVNLLVMSLSLAAASYDRRVARMTAEHARSLTVANEALERKVRERTQDLERALHSRNTVLRELQHRVRNNLQVVKSLLRLQARQFDEPRVAQAFLEAQNRVQSIALVHTLLFDAEGLPSTVDFDSYLHNLCAELARSYDAEMRRIAVKVSAEGISLPIETAVPAGLIINELVSNSFKHAFPVGSGEVSVKASTDHGHLSFSVSDNGIGFRGPHGAISGRQIGMTVIDSLAAQLGGTVQFHARDGTTATFTQMPTQERETG